jgi:hypothetical protein
MTLEIIWRNPTPPRKTQKRIELLVVDVFGALYSVIGTDRNTAFELILGGVA